MTDDTPDTDDATAVPPAQPFTFEVLLPLILQFEEARLQFAAMIRNDELYEARLKEFRKSQAAAEKAIRELTRREHAFNTEMTKEREAFAQKQAELAERERNVAALAAELAIHGRAFHDPYGRLEKLPGGGSREPDDEVPRRRDDPHYGRPSADAADDEMEIESAPNRPAGSNLTRSMPRPRKSMRRGVDA
jgi:hypothetical protein